MKRVQLPALLLVCMVFAGCGTSFTPAGRITTLNATVHTEEAGALLVRESFGIEPDSTGAIKFHRRVALDRADGVELVSAEADGAALEPGSNGLVVSRVDPRELDVTWTPAPAAGRARALTLVFRATSAIAVTEPRANLTWPLLASGRGYAVDRVDAEITVPAGAAVYPGTGVLEANWTVVRTASGVTAAKAGVADAESATLVAAFDFDRAGVTDPEWERNLDRQVQFLPALVAGGAFFFIIGIGTLIILRAQYPTRISLARTGRVGPSDMDRQVAARGLVIAGITGAGMAAVSAVIAATMLSSLGALVQLIPASMLIVAAVFVVYGPRLRS